MHRNLKLDSMIDSQSPLVWVSPVSTEGGYAMVRYELPTERALSDNRLKPLQLVALGYAKKYLGIEPMLVVQRVRGKQIGLRIHVADMVERTSGKIRVLPDHAAEVSRLLREFLSNPSGSLEALDEFPRVREPDSPASECSVEAETGAIRNVATLHGLAEPVGCGYQACVSSLARTNRELE